VCVAGTSVVPDMHIFTFADTNFFPVPVTDMPIYNHLWNRVGRAQTYSVWIAFDITNYVGGEPSTTSSLNL